MISLAQGRNKTIDLAKGFELQILRTEKRNVFFFTMYFFICFFYFTMLRNHKHYLLELFHISVKYFLSHYFTSRTSGLEGLWYSSHAFIWKDILGGQNVIILKFRFRTMKLCLHFHFLIPFSTIHAIFQHKAFQLFPVCV